MKRKKKQDRRKRREREAREALRDKVVPICEMSLDGAAVWRGKPFTDRFGQHYQYDIEVCTVEGLVLKRTAASDRELLPWMEISKSRLRELEKAVWTPRIKKSVLHLLAECAE